MICMLCGHKPDNVAKKVTQYICSDCAEILLKVKFDRLGIVTFSFLQGKQIKPLNPIEDLLSEEIPF